MLFSFLCVHYVFVSRKWMQDDNVIMLSLGTYDVGCVWCFENRIMVIVMLYMKFGNGEIFVLDGLSFAFFN
jgi:hypothetical protein